MPQKDAERTRKRFLQLRSCTTYPKRRDTWELSEIEDEVKTDRPQITLDDKIKVEELKLSAKFPKFMDTSNSISGQGVLQDTTLDQSSQDFISTAKSPVR